MSKRQMDLDLAEGHGQGQPSKKRLKEDLGQHRATASQSSTSQASSPPPNYTRIWPWSKAAISSRLPPLPAILDSKLEQEVFTHFGANPESNYEKLEWFGDACIEIIATDLIIDSFPNMSAGRTNQMREQLVRNITLAQFYRQYGMETRTRLPQDMEPMPVLMEKNPNDKEVIKIQGDVFEAYVGAIVRSDPRNGRDTAAQWLKALWGPLIKDQLLEVERTDKERDTLLSVASAEGEEAKKYLPKELLAKTIKVKGVLLRYVDEPSSGIKKDRHLNLPLFIIGVYMDGWGEKNKLLGVGTALKKSEAGQKAASMALQNKKLMKLYGDKKVAFMEAHQAVQATNEGQIL